MLLQIRTSCIKVRTYLCKRERGDVTIDDENDHAEIPLAGCKVGAEGQLLDKWQERPPQQLGRSFHNI